MSVIKNFNDIAKRDFLNQMFIGSAKNPLGFPLELYRYILSYLPDHDLGSLAQVAKSSVSLEDRCCVINYQGSVYRSDWDRWISYNKDFVFSSVKRLKLPFYVLPEKFLEYLTIDRNNVSSVQKLSQNKLLDWVLVIVKMVSLFKGPLSSTKKFVEYVKTLDRMSCDKRFPNIETLKISLFAQDMDKFLKYFKLLSQLKELEIPVFSGKVHQKQMIHSCPHLTKLVFNSSGFVMSDLKELSLIELEKLEFLEIRSTGEIECLELYNQGANLKKAIISASLRSFDFLSNASRLQLLEINNCMYLTNKNLKHIVQCCPNITSLTLNYCNKLEGGALLEELTHLAFLNIHSINPIQFSLYESGKNILEYDHKHDHNPDYGSTLHTRACRSNLADQFMITRNVIKAQATDFCA